MLLKEGSAAEAVYNLLDEKGPLKPANIVQSLSNYKGDNIRNGISKLKQRGLAEQLSSGEYRLVPNSDREGTPDQRVAIFQNDPRGAADFLLSLDGIGAQIDKVEVTFRRPGDAPHS